MPLHYSLLASYLFIGLLSLWHSINFSSYSLNKSLGFSIPEKRTHFIYIPIYMYLIDRKTLKILIFLKIKLKKLCLEVWLRLLFKVFFRAEIYQNDFFYFLKIIFKINASKRSKTYQKI